MIRTIAVLISVLISVRAYPQFSDSVHYYAYYSSSGIFNRTNNGNSFAVNNVLRFTINKKIMTLNTSNSWVYGEQQVSKTNNDFSSILDFDIYKNIRKLYYWGLGSYDKSFSLKINDRLQAGLGVGFTFLNTKTANIVFSDGIIYERNDLISAGNINNKYATFRNSARLKFRWVIRDLLVVEGVHFLQNSLSDNKDYIIKSNSSASFKLMKWLNFTTTVNYNKLTRTKRENLLITFGLNVEKYF